MQFICRCVGLGQRIYDHQAKLQGSSTMSTRFHNFRRLVGDLFSSFSVMDWRPLAALSRCVNVTIFSRLFYHLTENSENPIPPISSFRDEGCTWWVGLQRHGRPIPILPSAYTIAATMASTTNRHHFRHRQNAVTPTTKNTKTMTTPIRIFRYQQMLKLLKIAVVSSARSKQETSRQRE